jgi:hypothetical protein
MNFSSSLALLMSALVGGTAVVLTVDDLFGIYERATAKAAEVQARNDAQMLEAARIWYQSQGGPADASVQELVDKGFLKPEFLTRERVTPASPPPTSP